MDNLSNEIKRKIKIRKFAMDNLGRETEAGRSDSINAQSDDSELQKLYSLLHENIDFADQSKIQNGYSSIASNRKLGKIIVFVKRAIRKAIHVFLGWYIKPILDKQTFYNGKIVNSINLSRQIALLQGKKYTQKIMELERSISALYREINEMVIIREKYKELADSINDLSKKTEELANVTQYILNRLNVSCNINLLKQNNMDYFKFENTFRGPRGNVKEIQGIYVPYFMSNSGGIVLDIGCGRGEFLELMMENGINAYGIDNYEPFVKYCVERGFNVIKSDALTHLHSLENCILGGIFMSHVVEHLPDDYLRMLIITTYEKLKPGCYFIIETPNPDCLAALSEFYIDMGHVKPVHYRTLEYLFKEANFTSVERFHTEQSLYPLSAKHLDNADANNLEEFNKGIDNINGLLFGYRDYTLIAKK